MTPKEVMIAIAVLEQDLRCDLMDEQEKAEETIKKEGLHFDDYVEQDDGTKVGVIYPENAAPDLDDAIGHLHEAWQALQDHYLNEVTWSPSDMDKKKLVIEEMT